MGFSLLLVDDEPDVLDLLKETFQDTYDVTTASSGWKALDILRAKRVDALITDQRMPGMTGVQLIERAKVDNPELLCIILTAYTDPLDLITAINNGHVYRYLTKPFDITDLMQTVETALEEVRLRRENAQLLADAQRRMNALKLMLEISTTASSQSSYGDIIDTVATYLERVVSLDVSATLVRAEPNRPATLSMRSRSAVGDAELQQLRDEVLQKYRAATKEALPEADVLVRVTGRAPAPQSTPLGARLFIPLRVEGKPAGMLAVAAHRADAFNDDDATMLDVLANQASELIHGLRGKIEAERRRMNRLVEGMADGLIMTDASGEVVVSNSAARTLLDVPADQALTARFLRDSLSFYPFELVRGWERSGGHAVAEDVEVGNRVLHSLVSPVTEPDGRLAGVVVVLRDVTGERDLERKKEDFVADVSHELRTPLTAISGALDLLLHHSGPMTEKQQHFLSLARGAAARLNHTVDDLLDLSKAAREGLRPQLELQCLDEIVAEAVARFEAAFQLEGIQVIVKRPAEPVKALLDAPRLGQVLNNLLANALKFTPKGKRIEVDIYRLADVPGMAGFAVWNEGNHIEPDDIERIFQQYEQAKTTSGRQVRGTGLGLSISRTIVEAHHGRIWCESAPGRGVRFVVVVPVEGPSKEAPPAAAATAEKPAGADGKPAGEKQRVLVVDDDRAVGHALKGILLAAGYVVDVVTTADDALALARRTRPAACLVDVRMPNVDGAQLIEILRHDPDTRSTLIIACSSPDEQPRAQRAGAHSFLAKPVDSAKLAQALSYALQARREGARVLVVDDDAAIRTLCSESLRAFGYSVAEAPDAAKCVQQLTTFRPDLILLDVALPDRDGFEVIEEIKASRATSQISVIFISARGETRAKVRALQLGGDDYVVKPFDALELCARVETVLRRREAEAQSPTTMLPGSTAIDRAVVERIAKKKPFSLCYLDLDNLKAFNDYYGYAKADGIIQQTGDLLRSVMAQHAGPEDFLGHIAGDDFVFISSPDRVDGIARALIDAFDRIIPLYYDKEDRERGYIETDDRYGTKRRFPIMSISVVAVTDAGGRFATHSEIASLAAGLKKKAKAIAGSVFLLDDGSERASA